jgi:phytanoyl-CoA hydroxylase
MTLLRESPTSAESIPGKLNTLTAEQVAFFNENGFLRIEKMFTPLETQELSEELNWVIDVWAFKDAGWSGPWRKKYMNEETEKKSKLIALHDLQFYSAAWMRAATNRKLCGALADCLGPVVELHHTTLHVKPPETGHPFPMHQDHWFYTHTDTRFIDVLVHLDDTRHENGEMRFVPGSHKNGPIQHVLKDEEGRGCSPHLPSAEWHLENTTAVPANAGNVVFFNICTVHGSYINTTDRNRRLVRMGYRDPANVQTGGQSKGRPNLTVWGRRPRLEGAMPFSSEIG